MPYTLLHNPRCSKSRTGLALLQENGVEPEVRLYMSDDAHLSADELRKIAKKLGASTPREFLRKKDARDHGLATDATDDEVFAAMAENPKLIERPIGIKGARAVVGRPNEDLLEIV